MATKRRFDSPALQHTYDKFVTNDPELVAEYEHNIVNIGIAQRIYELRTKAGLTQRELASKVGTTASVICRLEDADYEGHSMSMMNRIALALGHRVEVRFVPVRATSSRKAPAAKRRAS